MSTIALPLNFNADNSLAHLQSTEDEFRLVMREKAKRGLMDPGRTDYQKIKRIPKYASINLSGYDDPALFYSGDVTDAKQYDQLSFAQAESILDNIANASSVSADVVDEFLFGADEIPTIDSVDPRLERQLKLDALKAGSNAFLLESENAVEQGREAFLAEYIEANYLKLPPKGTRKAPQPIGQF